jgi:hypothetical protein
MPSRFFQTSNHFPHIVKGHYWLKSGLPDGLFSYQFESIFEGFGKNMENVGVIYDHLEYLMAIWYNLHMAVWYSFWSFGIFFRLVFLDQENLATLVEM